MSKPPNKIKNWEQLINDGENYGNEGADFTPIQKVIFECIKEKKILKIQDSYIFAKTGHNAEDENHPIELAKLVADLEPVKTVTSLIITHNRLTAEALKILVESPYIDNIDYLHLGSNNLGDEGVKIIAQCPKFKKVETLNLECNGIGPEGGKLLASSNILTEVKSLSLVDNRLCEEGALAIANSDNLSNLTYLHLGGNRVKSEEVKQALRNSPKLTKLEKLKVF